MIKKFTFVFSITLISQLISLFSISFIVKRNASDAFIAFIALLDSSYLLINTILSFGIIQIASREIVVEDNWKKVVEYNQNVRINFSLILFTLGVSLYIFTNNFYYLTFLLSPLIALNVNYLFYAKGNPHIATLISSIRIFILSVPLILIGIFQYFSKEVYFLFFILGLIYVAYSSYSASETKIKLEFTPSFYKYYFKSIGVGISDLAIIFLEFGVLFFAAFYYKKTIIADAYILIKIITLFKGFQRMIFQVFYDQLIDKKKTFFLDQLILLTGFSFLLISFFFSKEILIILYSKENIIIQNNFIILGISLFIASIILASMARTLIIKKDSIYIKSYMLSLIFSFVTMIVLSYSTLKNYGISISLLVGETVLFFSFLKGIYKEIFLKKYVKNLLKYCFLFFLYYIISRIFEIKITFIIILVSQTLVSFIFLFQNKNIK